MKPPCGMNLEPKEGGIQPITIMVRLSVSRTRHRMTLSTVLLTTPICYSSKIPILDSIMNKPDQEILVDDFSSELIPTTPNRKSVPIEIKPEKTLNINPNLSPLQNRKIGSDIART
jgi:hypothetical protein